MFIKDNPVATDKIAILLISKEYLHIFNFYILIFQYSIEI